MSEVKALSKEKVNILIKQLQRNLDEAKKLGKEGGIYAHSRACGICEATIEITIKQLKGESYL